MYKLSACVIGAMAITIAASLLIPPFVSAQTSADEQKMVSAIKSHAQAAGTAGGHFVVLLVCPPAFRGVGDCAFTVLGSLANMTK
jgi:hypothetical protein